MVSVKRTFLSLSVYNLARILFALSLAITALGAMWAAPAQAGTHTPLSFGMLETRARHTATLLQNGKVLVVGGRNQNVLKSAELFDPVNGTWVSAAALAIARYNHTATLLLNGQVLVAGGQNSSGATNTTVLYDPAKDAWGTNGSLATARYNQTATLLPGGMVLVVGGQNGSGALGSAERYNPATKTWSAAGSLATARYNHTATLLPGGRVLVTGGQNGSGAVASSEIYNPGDNTWTTVTQPMTSARWGHTATVMIDGKVLVAGGQSNASTYLKSSELFTYNAGNPAASTWTATGDMADTRSGHSATLLPEGVVLVAGGFNGVTLGSTALYDPDSGTWSDGGPLEGQRSYHTATLLRTGEILFAGGEVFAPGYGTIYLSSSEKYDPSTASWTDTGSLVDARYNYTASLLPDGTVLVVGGIQGYDMLNSVERYNPATGHWSAANNLNIGRASHTATLLMNGKLLVVGGGDGSQFLTSAELFDPQTGLWADTGPLHVAREYHTATLLRSGLVLVTGGLTANGNYLQSAELYNPETGTWQNTGSMGVPREYHTATLLLDGRVLVTGGFNTGGGSGEEGYQKSSEIYDPGTGTWSYAAFLHEGRGQHSATLLADGQVLVTGGLNANIDPPTTSEVYDPASDTWEETDPMNYSHYNHSAMLLPTGKVLVAGGRGEPYSADPTPGVDATPLQICELYDPATGSWSTTTSMATPREYLVTTLLADGHVLAVGGFNTDALASAELYDLGLDYQEAWRPTITSIPATVRSGDSLSFSGTNLRGFQSMEATGGAGNQSASNYPLVELRHPDNGQVRWLMPDSKLGFSATAFNSEKLNGFPIGPASVTVYVNGIPSQSVMIQVLPGKIFVPLVQR